MKDRENQSEVARLLEQIREEYESAARGLRGFRQGTSQHSFINARYELIGQLNDELALNLQLQWSLL